MNNWPIGLSTGCFYRSKLVDCLETIRQSGFSMIEVVFSSPHLDYRDPMAVKEAAERIDALGMEAYSFHAPFGDEIDISSPDTGRREFALEEILRAVDAAALLGVHYFVIHPGPENADVPSREERMMRIENVCAVLDRVARRCTEAGIMCVLENKLPHLLFGQSADNRHFAHVGIAAADLPSAMSDDDDRDDEEEFGDDSEAFGKSAVQ